MRIGVLMTRHPSRKASPIMPEVIGLLGEWGADVEQLYPEEMATRIADVGVEHDLYVLKSGSELALSLAGALHAAGASILNSYPVAVACRDKVISTRILQSAGVPVPDTFVASRVRDLSPLLAEGPLVVKPYRGTGGVGVHIVWDPDQLDDVTPHGGVIFAQRYQQPDGRDRKIYIIGGQVFGVKRAWPARTYEQKLGEPFAITPELGRIALACGRALGIEMYGLDVIVSNGRPYVVDISSFPGFKGVPEAGLRLADYIYAAAARVLEGKPVVPLDDMVGAAA
jgi:ribosomal protein S6--L-glutamate ligase